ncbi:hypothetical protein M0813_21302 [Anaeramoeba flamelloides]|uniref:Uncharacterized protein n=1 Tax=Anaeramoeba flamelloides TaxID=1746091 RepID=A0ABQ8YHG5_9EUKA|nr:hypothetical protein M0813_21302 [Anaeramoeba flamelloides]
MDTLLRTSKKTFSNVGQINEKKTGNGVIGPFHYSELTLSSLCEIIGSKPQRCSDFLFFVPGYCLTFENEQVKNRWVWNWDKYYSSNSDLVAFLIHSSTYIPKKTSQSPIGLLVTIRFIDVKPPSFAMKRKNGIRSRYSSKLKGSCFFAKSIEIINDQKKVPTDYFSTPQLKEFMELNGSNRKRKFVTLNSKDFLKNSKPIFERNKVLNPDDQKKKRKKVNPKNIKNEAQPKRFKIKFSKHQLGQEQEKEQEHEQIKKKRNNKKKSIDHHKKHKKNSKKLYSHDSNRNRSPKRKKRNKKRNSSYFKLLNRKTKEKRLKRSPKIRSKYSPHTSSVSGSENGFDSQRQISEESDSETFAVINTNTDFDRKATLRIKNCTDQKSDSNNESDYKSDHNSESHYSSQPNSSFETNSNSDSVSESNSISERENEKKYKKKKKTKYRKRKKKRESRKSKHKKRSKQRRKKKFRKKEKRKMKTRHRNTSKNKNYKTKQNKKKKKNLEQNPLSPKLQLTNSVSLPNLVVSPISKQKGDLKCSNQSQNFCNSEPEIQDITELQNDFLSFLKYPHQSQSQSQSQSPNQKLNKEQIENLLLKKQIFFSIWKKCGSKQFLQTDFHSNNEELLDDSLLTELSSENNNTDTNTFTDTNTNENSFSSQSVLFSLSNEPCLSYSMDYLSDFGFQNKEQTYYKFRNRVLYLETMEKRYELSFEQNGLFRLAQILNPETHHFNSFNIPMDPQKIKIIKQNFFWGQIKWSANFILFGDFMIEPIKFFWCEKKQARILNNKEN